jgi:multidrug efflux pump subunit AcrA (membrane-fusion protein)
MNDRPNPNSQPGPPAGNESYELRHLSGLRSSPRKIMTGAVVVLLILAVFAVMPASCAACTPTRVLRERTYDLAAPTVNGGSGTAGAPVDTFVLPGNVTAYTDAPIYARTDGYLVHWYYDIGSKVKEGCAAGHHRRARNRQQVAQAESDLATAKPTPTSLAFRRSATRHWSSPRRFHSRMRTPMRTRPRPPLPSGRSAQANVQRVKELQSFEKGLCAV